MKNLMRENIKIETLKEKFQFSEIKISYKNT
jgi:hypothetical protein